MNDRSHENIDVFNYLDMNGEVVDGKLRSFNIKVLMKKFPDIDEFTLNKWKNKWENARQRMLSVKL